MTINPYYNLSPVGIWRFDPLGRLCSVAESATAANPVVSETAQRAPETIKRVGGFAKTKMEKSRKAEWGKALMLGGAD